MTEPTTLLNSIRGILDSKLINDNDKARLIADLTADQQTPARQQAPTDDDINAEINRCFRESAREQLIDTIAEREMLSSNSGEKRGLRWVMELLQPCPADPPEPNETPADQRIGYEDTSGSRKAQER